MHGNEFERQVQQRTEGLKVTPSEGLWDKIEAQLPKERKRRVAFWWWLPLLLLAVGGWWWMTRQPAANNTAATPSTEVTTTTLQANTVPLTTLGEGIDSGKALPQQPGLPVQQPAVGNDANIAMAPPATGGSASTRLWRPVRRGANVYIAPVFVNPSYPMNIKEALPDREDGGQTVNGMGFNKAIPDKAHGDVSWKPLAWAPTALPFDGRRTMAATMRQGQRVAIALQNNPMAKPPTEKKGWEWGLTLGGGVSWRQDRLFVDSVNNYDLGRAFNNAIINGGSGGLGNFGGFGRPQKPGLTLSVGLQANRKLAKRWSLQTGLEYTYSSYRQPVNLLLPDTSIVVITGVTNAPIRNSYRTGDSAIVAAGFHFINLPIALQYHLGRNRRWHLQTGLVLGYTVATNTLIYNPVNVGYFKSRQSLNRFNLSWLGGIAFQPKPNSAALAGIRASYNISSLVKQSIQVQRLMSAQVYWQIPLRKK